MRRIRKMLHGGEKGFTLIELLIVVAILGILAAVIIPNLSTFLGTGSLNAARTEAENVKTAALAYYADHDGTWPVDSSNLKSPIDYIQGTIKGTYSFCAVSGTIASAAQGSWTGVTMTWDAGDQTWDRTG